MKVYNKNKDGSLGSRLYAKLFRLIEFFEMDEG